MQSSLIKYLNAKASTSDAVNASEVSIDKSNNRIVNLKGRLTYLEIQDELKSKKIHV